MDNIESSTDESIIESDAEVIVNVYDEPGCQSQKSEDCQYETYLFNTSIFLIIYEKIYYLIKTRK